MADPASRQNFRVAAAIDFGTHSTGYAWVPVDSVNDLPATRAIQFRTQWPDQPVPAAKALSAVLFDSDGSIAAWGHTARKRHGAPARAPAGSYHYRFKLALQHGPAGGDALLSAPDDAVEVAGAYLEQIVTEAVRQITASGYQESDIYWCLTVPAIWDDHAKTLTRRAAERAGLPGGIERLRLVYEPEAAAVYCRIRGAHLAGTDQAPTAGTLSESSRYLVVDCGGGTADITAYQVKSSGYLDQIGKMSGGMFGSELVNEAFMTEVVADRIGGRDKVVDLGRRHPEAFLQLADAWEERKHTVAASVGWDGAVQISEPVAVPLNHLVYRALQDIVPDLSGRLLERQGDDNHIVVSPAELALLFDGVVDKIVVEVDQQLAAVTAQCGPPAGLETVLLVGGFSQSRYLQLRLSEHLRNRATVLVPAAGAEAVLAGAVHLCYNPELISARRSRYTYGFESCDIFEAGVDREDRKFVSGYGDTLCEKRFTTVVTINETVPADHQVKISRFATGPNQRELTVPLFTSTAVGPRYVDGSTARGELVVDISSTAGQEMPITKRGVDIVFAFGGAEVTVKATEQATGRTDSKVISFERTDSVLIPDADLSAELKPAQAPTQAPAPMPAPAPAAEPPPVPPRTAAEPPPPAPSKPPHSPFWSIVRKRRDD